MQTIKKSDTEMINECGTVSGMRFGWGNQSTHYPSALPPGEC
jgi:hypothetical protein